MEGFVAASADGSAVSVTLEVPSADAVSPPPAAPQHNGPLPFTGFDVDVLLAVALVVIVVGLLLVTVVRHRMEPSNA